MVRTTTGKGAGQIQWRRPQGARAVAQTRWFTQGVSERAQNERPSFLELLMPLVALSLGSIFAIAIAAIAVFALLSLVI